MKERYNKVYKENGRFQDGDRSIIKMGSIRPIRYPVKSRDKNPYIRDNRDYFDKFKLGITVNKVRNVLYKRYKNKCSICGGPLIGEEKIEIHHKKRKDKKRGGKR